MIYVYPDMRTVLIGQFRDGVMMEARPSKIIAERCNEGLKEIKVSSPRMESQIFSFERNNKLRIHHPRIMDPFEKNTVYVKETDAKGDGLFARRNIDANEVVSFYSGSIWTAHELTVSVLRTNETGYDR